MMSGYLGLQLALELSNILPIRHAVNSAFTQLMNVARELRNSGSDIVVEEDLAAVFGRGRVSSELERAFKAVVKVQKFTPLYNGSEIELHQGPGPTVLRALPDPYYFGTVLTLSMLNYFHGRQDLTALLTFAMTKRFEVNASESVNPPGSDGIAGTLEACSTQSAEFQWGPYRDSIEEKLRQALPNYRYSPDHCRLTEAVFLGAMDFFYIVQSLPEDSKITVSSEKGCIPLIIWAHYILGLTVALTGCPKGNVIIGDANEPQVFITWSAQENNKGKDRVPLVVEDEVLNPAIRLLDKDMSIIIACEPLEEMPISSYTSERNPLRGYGTTCLRRNFNVDIIAEDEDSIYSETVAYITGFALHASRRMFRELDSTGTIKQKPSVDSRGEQIVLEAGRIKNSAKMLFDGIPVESNKVLNYAKLFLTTPLYKSAIPATLDAFFQRSHRGKSSISPAERFLRQVEHLAKLVLVFGHVIELDDCGDMPLILLDDHIALGSFMRHVSEAPDNYGKVDPEDIFHAVASLLCHRFDQRNDTKRFSTETQYLYLCSDFGWSVFLSTVGDQDPAEVRPELIHVRKGTPTNAKTRERKLRIRDGFGFRKMEYPGIYPADETSGYYISRAIAKTRCQNEYWSSRSKEFESIIHTTFQLSQELQDHHAPVEMDSVRGYRELQCRLWRTFSTPECQHRLTGQENGGSPLDVRIGPDVLVLLGWSLDGELMEKYPQRIVVLLTKGEPHLRWLAVWETVTSRFDHRHRKVMLRTHRCCESCAIIHVASLNGEWALIM